MKNWWQEKHPRIDCFKHSHVMLPMQCDHLIEETMQMTDAEKAAFNNGYLLACCNLTNLHDRPELASDVLAEACITEAEVMAMDLCESDARALQKIREARPNAPLVS